MGLSLFGDRLLGRRYRLGTAGIPLFAESFLSTFYGSSTSVFVSFTVVIALLVLWAFLG